MVDTLLVRVLYSRCSTQWGILRCQRLHSLLFVNIQILHWWHPASRRDILCLRFWKLRNSLYTDHFNTYLDDLVREPGTWVDRLDLPFDRYNLSIIWTLHVLIHWAKVFIQISNEQREASPPKAMWNLRIVRLLSGLRAEGPWDGFQLVVRICPNNKEPFEQANDLHQGDDFSRKWLLW